MPQECYSQLVAEAVWINIVNIAGVITKVNRDSFELFTNADADPQSAYRKENKFIRFDPDTVFQSGERDDLKLGRAVQIIGLDLRNGVILATRVWIYEGKRPVRMGSGKVLAPDGNHFNDRPMSSKQKMVIGAATTTGVPKGVRSQWAA